MISPVKFILMSSTNPFETAKIVEISFCDKEKCISSVKYQNLVIAEYGNYPKVGIDPMPFGGVILQRFLQDVV